MVCLTDQITVFLRKGLQQFLYEFIRSYEEQLQKPLYSTDMFPNAPQIILKTLPFIEAAEVYIPLKKE